MCRLVAALLVGATLASAQIAPLRRPVVMTPATMTWESTLPQMPAGARVALFREADGPIQGFRARLPDGYRMPAHQALSHLAVTVLSGTLMLGFGESFNESAMRPLEAGSYAVLSGSTHYYAAKGETTLQYVTPGGFDVEYFNDADDPVLQRAPSWIRARIREAPPQLSWIARYEYKAQPVYFFQHSGNTPSRLYDAEGALLCTLTIDEKQGSNARCPGFSSVTVWGDTVWRVPSRVRSPQPPAEQQWRVVAPAAKPLNWGAAPPQLPAVGQFAPLVGELADLDGRGYLFAFRARLPAGYRLPPHTPLGFVAVTVISGTLRLGDGTSADSKSMVDLPVGSHALLGGATSSLHASEETLVQFDVLTPFRLSYENPSDDPALADLPWLARLIAEQKSSSPQIAIVKRFVYQGRRLYFVSLACMDCYESVFEQDGRPFCAVGGIHGGGDGRCPPDLRGALERGTTIWQARRRF